MPLKCSAACKGVLMLVKVEPLPMAEAQAFWRDKVQMGMGEFSRLADEAKVRAFAVSGIAKGDELSTVYTSIGKAIDQGISFGEFKKECREIFNRRGWSGKRGWRVDNIFRTNIQTAYNVGQYRQLRDSEIFTYWQYSAINDSRTRPTHLAMDGRVWPKDHPVWDTWFPPNGYRCRCSVIGLTSNQVANRGVTVEGDDPTNGLIEPIDPGTGNRMPARQLLPDQGFGFNPGVAYWDGVGEVMVQKMETWAPAVRTPALREILTGPVFAHWYAEPRGKFPVGRLDDAAAAQIGASSPVVLLSAETVAKQKRIHPELAAIEYGMVQETMIRGRLVQDTPQTLLYILDDVAGYVSVVKATLSGEGVFLVSFRRLSRDAAKRDSEVQRLLRKGQDGQE